MIYDVVFLIFGLALLAVAGDILIRGAVGLAHMLGMSPTIIGLTIVSFGTSAPELLVTISANLNGAPGMALGNVIGSNIANILLVLGVCAVITKLPKPDLRLRTETLFMAGTSIIFALLLVLYEGVSRFDGLIMLACLGLFLYRFCDGSRRGTSHQTIWRRIAQAGKPSPSPSWGLVLLPLPSDLLVTICERPSPLTMGNF
jgi:Ca2+/Na+ antiporter